jgi:hypothetical protein
MSRRVRVGWCRGVVVVLMLALTAPAESQDVPAPSVIAGWVQAYYAEAQSFRAHFTQSFWVRATGSTTTGAGEVRVARPGRFRFDYAPPSGNVTVRDDGPVTYYEPGDASFPGTVHYVEIDGTSAVYGILLGTSDLARDFAVRRHVPSAGASVPAGTVAIRLAPRRPEPGVRTIILYVSEAEATRGRVERLSYETDAGDFSTYTFTGTGDMHEAIDASVFRWAPPAGTREMSLRPPS